MNKKILISIIIVLILAAGIGAFFLFPKPAFAQPPVSPCGDGVCDEFERAHPNLCPEDCLEAEKNKILYVLWAVHVEGDTQECQIGQPCCQVGFYQERAFELMDVQGLENLQSLSENHIDSFGGHPKMYLSPAGEFIETELDSQYGNKAFRKYDWLALGHEIGPQPHKIYWSGQKFCWPTREMSKEGIVKKLTTLHQWAEKWYHNGQKVNHGLTYAPGMKLELPIFGKDLAALAEAEKFIDKEAYKLGYRISMEDWDAYVEDNPALGQRIPYFYQANYDDGTTMYKIGFQGAVKSDCQEDRRCETPQNAKNWINHLLALMKSDSDPTHLYYFAFATHPYNPPPPENYLQGEEIQGAIQVFEYLDELVKSGVKIKYITPKDFVALLKEPPTATPSSYQDSPFGIHDPTVPQVDSIEDVAATGAKWVRYAGGSGIVWDVIERQKGQFGWTHHDQLYLETFKNNIKMFVSILPANSWDRPITEGRPEQIPRDMEAYKNFLRKAVERYDGDGIDDAPGSPVISVWQISNELDLCWNDTPADYAKLLKESYKIIKQANPQAKVAIAGVGTPQGFDGVTKFYVPLMEELAKIRDNPTDRYFDVFDFHWYPFEGQYNYLHDNLMGTDYVTYLKDYIKNINNTLAKYGYDSTPIFITETAQYSGLPAPPKWMKPPVVQFHSEKKQVLDLYKIYVYSLANGVKKLFWVTLTEWHDFAGQPNGVFDNVGLINNPQNGGQSHKKLSYYTYKKMVEILEGSDWNNIQTIQESDGIYIYKFTKQAKSIWVAWNDNPGEKEIIISDIPAKQVKIIEAVPKYKSGKDVKDYKTAFTTETKSASNGKVTITLKDTPMFIEEQ